LLFSYNINYNSQNYKKLIVELEINDEKTQYDCEVILQSNKYLSEKRSCPFPCPEKRTFWSLTGKMKIARGNWAYIKETGGDRG